MKNRLRKLWHQDGTRSVMASVLSILAGLVAGSVIILIVGLCNPTLGLKSVWDGVRLIFGGLFATGRDAAGALTFGFNPVSTGNMLFRATPLIMTGLSVAVAFKTGLFNIGAPGQYLMGTMASLMIALGIPSDVVPPAIIWLLAFLGGAAVLAFGIVAVKIIGAVFKIPLRNILGEGGSADFSNAYNIYATLLTVSTAGLPVALSKLVSESYALGRTRQAHRTFRVSLSVFLVLGVASFALMWWGSDLLAGFLNNPRAAYGIRALAPAVVCVGCLSAFRGYAQGRQYMTPTAVSQIIEALCKLVLGLALSMWLLRIGQPDYIAAAGAIAGVTAGTILSLVYMAIDYLRHRPALRRGESCAPDRAILRRLLALAIPITLSSSMVSLITLIDTKLVQGRLQDALGYTLDQMRAAYGNYSACMDLYNLPSSLMVALTASVIPAVSAAVTQRDRRQSARIVRSSLRVTALLAFPMGLGLWALSDPLFRLFYRSYNAELGGSLLAVLGIASIFVCLMLITNSILQAYGRVSVPIVTMLVGGGVKIVLNYNLVALPSVNIHGAPIGTLVCFALTALLNLIAVARIAPFRLNYPGYFLRPLFASLVMAFAARGVYALAAHFLIPSVEEVSRLTLLLCVGLAIGVAVVIYGVLVLALHCIRRSDLELLPKGDKLARLLHIS